MPIYSGGGGGGGGLPAGVTSPATGALALATTAASQLPFVVNMPIGAAANQTDAIRVNDESGTHIVELSADGSSVFKLVESFASFVIFDTTHNPSPLLEADAGYKLGFFGKAPAAQPALTSATTTPELIALALESLGIASGT